MKAHEIFNHISLPLATEMFTFLHTNEKPMYKAAIQGLANQRNLRPVFIERKPPNERFPWIKSALGKRISDTLAAHLLQAWLLGAHKQMLCDFLDALEIAHDDDGTVEVLPTAPPKEQIKAAADALLKKYPAEAVAIYLHAFRDMDSAIQWPPLNELLEGDARLKLAAA